MQTSIQTRGFQVDYSWKTNAGGIDGNRFKAADDWFSDTNKRIFCGVIRNGDLFDFFARTPAGALDSTKVPIFNTFGFLGIDGITARALCLLYLEDNELFQKSANPIVNRFEKPQDSIEWSANFSHADDVIRIARDRSNLEGNSQAISSGPYGIDFKEDKEEPDNATKKRAILDLCNDLRNHSFSNHDGIKILIAEIPKQGGYQAAKDAPADRLLWQNGSSDDGSLTNKHFELTNKKKADRPNSTQSSRSSEPSRVPLITFGEKLIAFLLLDQKLPNSLPIGARISPTKLLIFSGVLVVAATGTIYNLKKKIAETETTLIKRDQAHRLEVDQLKSTIYSLNQEVAKLQAELARPQSAPPAQSGQ